MDFYGKSDKGMRRTINEDSFANISIWGKRATLLVVCDGMGGHNAGEVASAKAVEAFCDRLASSPCLSENPLDKKYEIKKIMTEGIKDANKRLLNLSNAYENLNGMGTTLVAGLVFDNVLYCTNIGDSRLYIISGEIVKQVSHDHSFVQQLLDQRKITREEAKNFPHKNIITKAIGQGEQTDVTIHMSDLASFGSGYILLCTDGLYNYLDDKDFKKIFADAKAKGPGESGKDDLIYAVDTLIGSANSGGGADNITALVARF